MAARTTTVARNSPKKPTKKEAVDSLKVAQRASALFKQVSDATRLQVVMLLMKGEMNVGELSAQLTMSQPAVSHHLALLRHGGIIVPRRDGKNNYYGLSEMGEALAQVVVSVVE